MPDRGNNRLRFLSLGALTVAAAAATRSGLKAFGQAEVVPKVDALEQPAPGGGEWPCVSIIVPARNEQRNLPRLLPSLLSQRYPSYEVIVVDDQSEDATPRILAERAAGDPRLKIVRGTPLPGGGWLGKPWAMHQGAAVAQGDRLLFTDADTVHDPLSISSSVAYAISHHIDLFTISPCAELLTPAERIVMPVAFQGIFVLYPISKINDPEDDVALANGQYILIRRGVYDAVGGIDRVKDRIVEDMEFARVVKGEGYRLHMADGRDLMSVRMYTSTAEMWEGWGKNVLISFQGKPGQAALVSLSMLAVTVLPLMAIARAARAWRRFGVTRQPPDGLVAAWVTGLAAWNVAIPIVFGRKVDRMLGISPIWALTQPLGVAFFALLMLNSLVRLLLGKGVTWKGRTYEERR